MNTFETTRLGAKPWSQAVCVFSDAGLEDESSLTGMLFSIRIFLIGLERDYSSISEGVYVGTISTCSAAVASSDFVFLE